MIFVYLIYFYFVYNSILPNLWFFSLTAYHRTCLYLCAQVIKFKYTVYAYQLVNLAIKVWLIVSVFTWGSTVKKLPVEWKESAFCWEVFTLQWTRRRIQVRNPVHSSSQMKNNRLELEESVYKKDKNFTFQQPPIIWISSLTLSVQLTILW